MFMCFNDSKKRMWKFLNNTTKTAWTRLCKSVGTEWELPEDDALVWKHVGEINKEQYNKLLPVPAVAARSKA
jgi:hypothetical protein